MARKVIIIGGGIAGLSAGAYLQMNGFNTEIFEMNGTPGGVCTSWKRGDYTVDWCVHWLVGSGPANSFYDRWNELTDISRIEIVNHDTYAVVENEKGDQVHIFTDLERLEAEMLRVGPEDKEKITEFIHACRKLSTMDMPSEHTFATGNLWFKIKALWQTLPYLSTFGKFSRITTIDYANSFKNPLLRKAFANFFEPEMPILFCMMTLAWMHTKAAGYPIGGSLNFSQRIADCFSDLGGRFHFNSRVEKILVENNRAAGIQLMNGERHMADIVISAADGHATLYHMLEGKFLSPDLLKMYEGGKTFPSLVFLALGVARTFHAAPHSYFFPLKQPLQVDPETSLQDIYIRIHNFDPTLAPYGKTLISCMMETRNWSYWLDLQRNAPDQYKAEKDRLIQQFINILDDKFGEVRDLVEMSDISTPATIIGFTNNWQGSFEGWLATPETGFNQLPNTLPGLDNFYMCGHWVAPGGGIPTAMHSGRTAAEMICIKNKVPFNTKKTHLQNH